MKLKKPILTILLIIILVFILIFFSLSLICRNITKKSKIEEILYSFNIQKHINDDESITNSIQNYYYPKEVFNYIDHKKLKEIESRIIDNLYASNEIIIEEKTINELLTNSVLKYDSLNKKDSTIYVEKDIDNYSKKLSNTINTDLKDIYNILVSFSSDLIIILFLVSSIIITIVIVKNEKLNGVFISSITLFFYSFLLYYFDNNLIKKMGDKNYLEYFNNYKNLNLDLEFTYIICFILSFVLLLIYMVEVIKIIIKKIEVNNY